jgi:hypothetical protein
MTIFTPHLSPEATSLPGLMALCQAVVGKTNTPHRSISAFEKGASPCRGNRV